MRLFGIIMLIIFLIYFKQGLNLSTKLSKESTIYIYPNDLVNETA